MRQLTYLRILGRLMVISKLPMRQLTSRQSSGFLFFISKLPMRQLTFLMKGGCCGKISKLPMRQLTMPERKKNPTARALIHLFPTLTQIYSCFKIY